jgi:uncharacterized membrane protein (UPF0127 family)
VMRRRSHGIVLVALAAACGGDAPDAQQDAPPPLTGTPVEVAPVSFDSAVATLTTSSRTIEMTVEIAERADQRAYGLMDRDELDAESGMIFLYDEPQHRDSGFWMYRTRIPLDIAYFDGAGRIVAIHQMMPCTSLDAARCTGYSAGVEYFGALETNRGWFARNGVGVGDRITLPGRIGG